MYVYVLIPKHWDTMWGEPLAFKSKKNAEEYAKGNILHGGNVHYEIYKLYAGA